MRKVGLIILAVAVLLGGIAMWGVISMQRANAQMHETHLVVAARAIQLGQALTPDMLRMQAWPAEAVPQGSFTQVSELTTGEARVALRAIEPNEPILSSRISGAGGRATLSATITEGHRAVAIRVNDVVGVAGFVLPGDFVDVLLTRSDTGQNFGPNQQMRTDLLIAGVRVLAIDQISSESRNDPQVARAVTIEVTPVDGQKVALAGQIGTLSLSLRRADDLTKPGDTTPPPQTVRIEDLRAAAEARTHVAPPAPHPVRAAVVRPSGPIIEITRGFATNRAAVTTE
jgi:pilus assembly protein CpaB